MGVQPVVYFGVERVVSMRVRERNSNDPRWLDGFASRWLVVTDEFSKVAVCVLGALNEHDGGRGDSSP